MLPHLILVSKIFYWSLSVLPLDIFTVLFLLWKTACSIPTSQALITVAHPVVQRYMEIKRVSGILHEN